MDLENSLNFSMFVEQSDSMNLENSSKYLTYGDWRDQCQYPGQIGDFVDFSEESLCALPKPIVFSECVSLKQTSESIQCQDGEIEWEMMPISEFKPKSDYMCVEEPQNLLKVFSVTRVKRVKSIGDRMKNSYSDFNSSEKLSTGSTKIRRDVVNKSILRALRKYYRKVMPKLSNETRIYDNPTKFLEAYKEQILKFWSSSGILEGLLVKGKNRSQKSVSELVSILCWLVIPQWHHSMLKTQLYTCESIQVLDKVYRRYSHKVLMKVFHMEPLKHLFSHFCVNGLHELNLGNHSLERDCQYEQAIEDFKANFQTLF